MVEGDGGHGVVEDVGFAYFVEEVVADPAEGAVHGGGGAALVVPYFGVVAGEGGVGVVEVGYCDCWGCE